MIRGTNDYRQISTEEILQELQSDRERGLTAEEARERHAKFGYSEIPEKYESAFQKVLRRFWGPIPWMIEAAAVVQSFTFLKLAVAGHLTIFITRTENRFWRKPYPAPLLFRADFITKIAATVFAVYGWFVAWIGWKYALLVWAYALVWFVINDCIKIWTLKLLRRG